MDPRIVAVDGLHGTGETTANMEEKMAETATIYLVDDDLGTRQALSIALDLAGYRVTACDSAAAFLEVCPKGAEPGCVLLDLRMPGMNGLDLQQTMKESGCTLPVIFMSGDGDIRAGVTAVKEGAVDFLEKPFPIRVLVERIEEALALDSTRRAEEDGRRQIGERMIRLTAREREVMQLVVKGLSNKEIAKVLDISPRTVENHRAQMMAKMQADNIAELCQMAAQYSGTPGEIAP